MEETTAMSFVAATPALLTSAPTPLHTALENLSFVTTQQLVTRHCAAAVRPRASARPSGGLAANCDVRTRCRLLETVMVCVLHLASCTVGAGTESAAEGSSVQPVCPCGPPAEGAGTTGRMHHAE